MHSPTDDTVGIDNATRIFIAAKHPKSFVSLADTDHLLSRKKRRYLCRRCDRHLGHTLSRSCRAGASRDRSNAAPRNVVVRETRDSKYQQTVTSGRTICSPTSRSPPAARNRPGAL